jgi:hypothetical protein
MRIGRTNECSSRVTLGSAPVRGIRHATGGAPRSWWTRSNAVRRVRDRLAARARRAAHPEVRHRDNALRVARRFAAQGRKTAARAKVAEALRVPTLSNRAALEVDAGSVTPCYRSERGRRNGLFSTGPSGRVSLESEKDSVHCADWLTLLGFYQEAEALQLIQNQGVKLVSTIDEWRDQIRRARDAVARIQGRSNIIVSVEPLGDEFAERIGKLKNEPTFSEQVQGATANQFAWVDISGLKCFQPQLNLEYIQRLAAEAPKPSDVQATVAFCLPTRGERALTEVLAGVNPVTNTFTAVTQNLDLRVLGHAQSEDSTTGRKIAGFVWGFGLPQVGVAEYKGGFFIKNGYHRAYALSTLGHKRLPCLLTRTDFVQFTGLQSPGMFSPDVMNSDRCPLLTDFSTDAAVPIPHRRLRMVLSVHAEVQAVAI